MDKSNIHLVSYNRSFIEIHNVQNIQQLKKESVSESRASQTCCLHQFLGGSEANSLILEGKIGMMLEIRLVQDTVVINSQLT